jgi:ATP-dependent RNA helicase DbpA
MKFENLEINAALKQALVELKFETLTPIQEKAIPLGLEGKDIIGQSKTGSGKTLAFGLPILDSVELEIEQVQSLILCPTRELAQQVARDLRAVGRKFVDLKILIVVGGEPTRNEQAQALHRGVHIVVGTPGRVLDLARRNQINLMNVKSVVLDEADEMLDMGFEEDVRSIMKFTPEKRQTLLFSATFPEKVVILSRDLQNKAQKIEIAAHDSEESKIEYFSYQTIEADKPSILIRVLQQHPSDQALVFVNHRATANDLQHKISELGVACEALHGELEQKDRERVMAKFRNGSLRVLIATDVAARGLHIDKLGLVVNYDLPHQIESFTHRAGRTGRAGESGIAVTIGTQEDSFRIAEIESRLSIRIQKPVLGFESQFGFRPEFKRSAMRTLQIAAGRKQKLRPGDVLGALTGAGVNLKGSDIGKIEIGDWVSYVAVRSEVSEQALRGLRDGRIKAQKFNVALV